MKTVFLFDLDGVIIKTRFFTEKYEADFGVGKESILQFLKKYLPSAQVGKIDLREVLREGLKDFGWEKSVDEFLTYWFEYDNLIDQDLVQEIKKLRKKGHYCFLLTNQEKHRYNYLVKMLHIGDMFDEIFSSHIIGSGKAQREYFSQVGEILKTKYNIDKRDCVFFDDKENFIETARQVGFESVLYTKINDFLNYKNTIQ